MKIEPDAMVGSHRTGTLKGTTVGEIQIVLGFPPNIEDDEDKVENSWGFTANGQQCAIWDFKGSHHFGQFSTFGPHDVFENLFPGKYTRGI